MDLEHALGERMAREPDLEFALLFGSQADGRPRSDSDIDIAVHFAPGLSNRERFRRRLRLGSDLAELGETDVVVLNDAPPLLAHRALMGRLLAVNDRTAYVRYFVRTLAASGDERYWRRMALNERRTRLEEGRFGRS
jgi:predicted nucleotidyltransferase